jgi:hypothetical protein
MMKKIILTALLLISILFFKKLELLLLNFNFSWTISKIFPFALVVTLSFLLFWKLKKLNLIRNRILNYLLFIVFFVLPFGIAFALNPIYEGDFSIEGKSILPQDPRDFKGNDFIVITIPGCKYCHESTEMINLLQERNPDLKIKFLVCSSNEKELQAYRKKLLPKVNVSLSLNIGSILNVNQGKFPSFVLNREGKYTIWDNNNFGVRARDLVEAK